MARMASKAAVRFASSPLLSVGGLPSKTRTFGSVGSKPRKLPPGQSIYGLSGQVTVNDKEATLATQIKPGDTVQTGQNSEVVFIVNTHSMILRGDSKLLIEAPWRAAVTHPVGWDIAVAPLAHASGALAGAALAWLLCRPVSRTGQRPPAVRSAADR